MTQLDQFLIDESKRHISQNEKTYEDIIASVIDNLMDQIRVDPFRPEFVVHLVKVKSTHHDNHEVVHSVKPAELLFYLSHYGLSKISSNALLRSNLSLDKIIRVVVVNHHYR